MSRMETDCNLKIQVCAYSMCKIFITFATKRYTVLCLLQNYMQKQILGKLMQDKLYFVSMNNLEFSKKKKNEKNVHTSEHLHCNDPICSCMQRPEDNRKMKDTNKLSFPVVAQNVQCKHSKFLQAITLGCLPRAFNYSFTENLIRQSLSEVGC